MTLTPHVDAKGAGPADDRLVSSLQQWRDADLAASPEPRDPELRAIEAHRALVEQAKGALMMRYGLDSYQAFAVLVRWARITHTPVHTIAGTLVRGICEGNPETGRQHVALMRWMQDRLRDHEPDVAGPPPPGLPSQRAGG